MLHCVFSLAALARSRDGRCDWKHTTTKVCQHITFVPSMLKQPSPFDGACAACVRTPRWHESGRGCRAGGLFVMESVLLMRLAAYNHQAVPSSWQYAPFTCHKVPESYQASSCFWQQLLSMQPMRSAGVAHRSTALASQTRIPRCKPCFQALHELHALGTARHGFVMPPHATACSGTLASQVGLSPHANRRADLDVHKTNSSTSKFCCNLSMSFANFSPNDMMFSGQIMQLPAATVHAANAVWLCLGR